MRKTLALLLAAALTAAAIATAAAWPRATAEERDRAVSPARPAAHSWDKEVVDLFARLPVQDGGRVKPLSTYARYTLTALNGRQSTKTAAGDPISATEWLLDCLFFPDIAATHPSFVVDNEAALDAVGLAHEGKSRRDRYSYQDLAPARAKLRELAGQYMAIEEKKRNPLQGQVVDLYVNVSRFEALVDTVAPAVHGPRSSDSPVLAKVFGPDARPTLSQVLLRADAIRAALQEPEDPHAQGRDPLADWLQGIVESSGTLTLLPPPREAAANSEWLTSGALAAEVLFHGAPLADQLAALGDLEEMYASRQDPDAFRRHAEDFRARSVGVADARGEYAKVPVEVAFYRLDPFYWALIVFVLAFAFFTAPSWHFRGKLLPTLSASFTWGGLALVVAGITLRCVIRSRPPVSTLYETILFVTGVAVLAALVTEKISRRGIAGSAAPLLGAAGMFLANRYEVTDGVDTMPSLVAVLDTNFWLATHVTTVTIGYAAGLLAGAIGHVYLFAKAFGLKKGDPGFFKSLTSMTYGVLCFGLLFSFVGTVLGGIWANDSWGRFWGWDPKENGALAIVLWELIVLHARMAGYIRGFGLAMASIFGGMVVAASWWGVNLLGVGLHSYGFTSGILVTLLGFFAVETAVLLLGAAYQVFGPGEAAAPADPAVPPLPPSG